MAAVSRSTAFWVASVGSDGNTHSRFKEFLGFVGREALLNESNGRDFVCWGELWGANGLKAVSL